MPDQHRFGITEVLAHGVHVGGVRRDVDLVSIHRQAATPMATIVEMGDRH
jgi:hypothetical protein